MHVDLLDMGKVRFFGFRCVVMGSNRQESDSTVKNKILVVLNHVRILAKERVLNHVRIFAKDYVVLDSNPCQELEKERGCVWIDGRMVMDPNGKKSRPVVFVLESSVLATVRAMVDSDRGERRLVLDIDAVVLLEVGNAGVLLNFWLVNFWLVNFWLVNDRRGINGVLVNFCSNSRGDWVIPDKSLLHIVEEVFVAMVNGEFLIDWQVARVDLDPISVVADHRHEEVVYLTLVRVLLGNNLGGLRDMKLRTHSQSILDLYPTSGHRIL
jgi:hypothetical protein